MKVAKREILNRYGPCLDGFILYVVPIGVAEPLLVKVTPPEKLARQKYACTSR